jgi:hypothetical protein
MKLKALLFIFTTVSMLYAGCLTDEERNKLIIDGDPKDFEYIPNYIQCDHKKSNLEKFVCNHSDYLLMFHYLSQKKSRVKFYFNGIEYRLKGSKKRKEEIVQ